MIAVIIAIHFKMENLKRVSFFVSFFLLLFFFFFFFLFKAKPMVYGGSQARGRIGAAAAGLHHSHSNIRAELCLRPTPQLMARPDP